MTTVTTLTPPTRLSRRVAVLGVLGAISFATMAVVSVFGAAPAFAHASLAESTPIEGAILDVAPTELVLRFTEPVEIADDPVKVYADDGVRVDRGRASLDPDASVVRIPLPADLGEGSVLVSWRVLSEDSHVITGTFTFSIGTVTGDRAALTGQVDEPSDRGYRVAAGIVRGLGYAGALLAVGGVVFLALVAGSRPARLAEARLIACAALVAIVAGGASVFIQTAVTSGIGRRAFTDGSLVRATFADDFGTSVLVRGGGLLMLVAGLAMATNFPVRLRYVASVVGAFVVVLSFPLTGHTRTATPRALVVIADITHASAVAVWFGGVVFLALALRAGVTIQARSAAMTPAAASGASADADRSVLVRRFSRLATVALGAVAASGMAYAIAQTRSIEALTSTTYGRLLLVKLGLVGIIGALALRNRRKWVPEAGTGPTSDQTVTSTSMPHWRAAMLRNVRGEAALMVVVVALTSALVVTRPAHEAAAEAADSKPFSGYLAFDGQRQVNLVIDPARAGTNVVHLYLLDDAGLPADFSESVRLILTHVAGQVAPSEVGFEPVTPSHFQASLLVPVPGTYDVTVVARVSEFDEVSTTTTVVVAPGLR